MTVFSTTSPEGEHSPETALAHLARHLRLGVGQEWRAELEAAEIETHQQRLRGRTLRQVAEMLLHRGDMVTLQTGDLRVTGTVTGCGLDYISLETDNLWVDARLERLSLLVARRSAGGAGTGQAPPTWRARLTEFELTQEPVELHAPSLSGSRRGRIRVVAADHVWLVESEGVDCYLPMEEIAAAVRRRGVTRPHP